MNLANVEGDPGFEKYRLNQGRLAPHCLKCRG
jgi:hypothetical protein